MIVQALAGGTPGTSGSLSKLRWCQLQTRREGGGLQHSAMVHGASIGRRPACVRVGDAGGQGPCKCTQHMRLVLGAARVTAPTQSYPKATSAHLNSGTTHSPPSRMGRVCTPSCWHRSKMMRSLVCESVMPASLQEYLTETNQVGISQLEAPVSSQLGIQPVKEAATPQPASTPPTPPRAAQPAEPTPTCRARGSTARGCLQKWPQGENMLGL